MEEIKTDVLVIGGGIAGIWTSLKAKEKVDNVCVVDKGFVGKTSHSALSAGSMIVVMPEDDLETSVNDLIQVHKGFIDRTLAEYLLGNSFNRFRDLEEWGVGFVRSGFLKRTGDYVTYPARGSRILKNYVSGGHGEGNLRVVIKEALHRGVKVLNRVCIADLLTDGERVIGAIGMDVRRGEPYLFQARAIVIATNTTGFRGNYFGQDMVGDGPMIAYRSGAELEDAEFVLTNVGSPVFHFEGTGPTAAFGATYRNIKGEAFMERYEPELKNRAGLGAIIKAMTAEVKQGRGPIRYDFTTMSDEFWNIRLGRRPWNYQHLGKTKVEMWGINHDNPEWMPAHMSSGVAIRTGFEGTSSLPGVFAAGKVRGGTGVGGLNGWHWCFCPGTGFQAGEASGEYANNVTEGKISKAQVNALEGDLFEPLKRDGFVTSDLVLKEIQKEVFPYDVLILKQGDKMQRALDRIYEIRDEIAPRMAASDIHELMRLKETENILLNAEMSLRTSIMRTESRGVHYREDFPNQDDDNWLKSIVIRRSPDGKMELIVKPLGTQRDWLRN